MADLAALQKRVRAASGPDRELDAQIVTAINNAKVKPYPVTDDFGPKSKWQFWSMDGAHFLGNESKFPVPPLTASLEAALALVGRMLPGHQWQVNSDDPHRGYTPYAELTRRVPNGRDGYCGRGATPALAVADALLSALIAQHSAAPEEEHAHG